MNEILLSALTVIITGIIGFVGTKITSFLNERISSEKINRIMNQFLEVVSDSVRATYQLYVEKLKDEDLFDKEAQLNALNMTKEHILKILPANVLTFLRKIYPDINAFIELQIEKAIYELKKNA